MERRRKNIIGKRSDVNGFYFANEFSDMRGSGVRWNREDSENGRVIRKRRKSIVNVREERRGRASDKEIKSMTSFMSRERD